MNLDASIQKIADLLKLKQLRLITAESCTGGGLGFLLTSIPGSSAWFEGGFVSYSNQAKAYMLNVDPDSIQKYGAVSEQVAKAMAEGALTNSMAQVSVAITGIAGPEGGTDDKPVGTVWIACAQKNAFTYAAHYIFQGDREKIRIYSINQALENLFNSLQ